MGTRRVTVVGGGPAGLFLARMIGLTQPGTEVEVLERRPAGESYGFGVTLSVRAMSSIAEHDPSTHARIVAAARPLSGVEVRVGGSRLNYAGFGTTSVCRRTLLRLLTEQAVEVGARIRHGRRIEPGDPAVGAGGGADVVVLADGAGSAHRNAHARRFGTTVRTGRSRYIWLGTAAGFGDVSTLVFESTRHGPMAAHCYSYGPAESTAVVEMDDATWQRAGLDRAVDTDGRITPAALDLITGVFAGHLGGHSLVGAASRWSRFDVVRNQRWHDRDTVLVGDAAHTAHFTVSSGTKLAVEDALALALELAEHRDHRTAFAAYEARRRPQVERTQRLGETSMHWWETFGRRMHLPPAVFGVHFLTRTGVISAEGLRRRCADRLDEAARVVVGDTTGARGSGPLSPAEAPLTVGRVGLQGRIVEVGRARRGSVDLRDPVSGNTVQFAALRCPDVPEWHTDGDALVGAAVRAVRDGAAGVVLESAGCWDQTTRHASRVRTEGHLPVAVPYPPATDVTGAPVGGVAGERVDLALLAGRVDLVLAPCRTV